MIAVVIEDSRTQAARLRVILTRAGFAVRVAFDGETGIAACTAGGTPADLVISDVLMPRMDGFEVCRRLKSAPETSGIPVMLLTALSEPIDVVRALAAGADNFVSKPYRDERLLSRIGRMIENHKRPEGEATLTMHGQTFPVVAPRSQILDLLVSCLEDAAERNAELEASRAELIRASEQREDLLGIVAHELKTPLTALLMRAQHATQHIAGLTVPDAVRVLPDVVSRQSRRMVRLIDDLLDFARADSGTLRVEPRDADLATLVRDVVERQRVASPDHELVTRAPGTVLVHIDAARIDQVLTNLLSNAVKYSQAGTAVEVTLETPPGAALIRVRDSGIGIEPEAIPHLFSRYFRTRSGQSAAAGIGLGLFICKRLVDLHGGTIGVESIPGQGSMFWFSLPCDHRPADPSPVGA